MNVKLVVIGGKRDGMEIPVSTPTFVLGRADSCHIRPQNSLVSQIHCQISVDRASVAIEDCSSALGTLVNGERIKWRHNLKDGDRIKIATLEFEVRLVADEPAAKEQPAVNMPVAAHHAAASTDAVEREAEILQWVKHEEKVGSSPLVVTLQYAKPEKRRKKGQLAASTEGRVESGDYEEGFDWDVIDLLLLSAAGPLVVVLLSLLPTYWMWRGTGGIVLAALAAALGARANRTHELKLDELTVATGILAILVVSLMLPTDWLWRSSLIFLTALSLLLGLRMMGRDASELDETSVTLLVGIGLLLLMLINLSVRPTLWMRLDEAGTVLVAIGSLLWFRLKGRTGRESERLLLLLATIGLLLVVILGFLLPIPLWLKWLTRVDMGWCWWWLRKRLLHGWWCIWWLRWGAVAFLVAVLTVLLRMRTRQTA
jgi:pSer/pThr/pTyr-binding forkhead associated (FHA) protein